MVLITRAGAAARDASCWEEHKAQDNAKDPSEGAVLLSDHSHAVVTTELASHDDWGLRPHAVGIGSVLTQGIALSHDDVCGLAWSHRLTRSHHLRLACGHHLRLTWLHHLGLALVHHRLLLHHLWVTWSRLTHHRRLLAFHDWSTMWLLLTHKWLTLSIDLIRALAQVLFSVHLSKRHASCILNNYYY